MVDDAAYRAEVGFKVQGLLAAGFGTGCLVGPVQSDWAVSACLPPECSPLPHCFLALAMGFFFCCCCYPLSWLTPCWRVLLTSEAGHRGAGLDQAGGALPAVAECSAEEVLEVSVWERREGGEGGSGAGE